LYASAAIITLSFFFIEMHQSDFLFLSLSTGTVKVKSSGIQVGDLIIVEKVGLLISSVIVGNQDLLTNGISYLSMLWLFTFP